VSVTDLHPENLLDKEIRGELDPLDRERLEAHLAACPTCRFERRMRAEFALELAREGLAPDLVKIVETVAKRSARERVYEPNAHPVSSTARRAKLVFLAASAVLTLVVGAFASTEEGRRVLAPLFASTSGAVPADEASSAAPSGRRGARISATVASSPSPEVPTARPTTVAQEIPSAIASDPPAQTTRAEPEGPATLLEAETDARHKGDLPRLLELHARLAARYPLSHETQVSRMVVAHVLLDRGESARALSAFDDYLAAGSGELREDALAGRATSLDRLGRDDEGRHAWRTLLDEYPGSAYATHAQARIEASAGN
jgi:anti-sigma factor RsiW